MVALLIYLCSDACLLVHAFKIFANENVNNFPSFKIGKLESEPWSFQEFKVSRTHKIKKLENGNK